MSGLVHVFADDKKQNETKIAEFLYIERINKTKKHYKATRAGNGVETGKYHVRYA